MASVDDVADVAALPHSLSSAAQAALPQSPRAAGTAGTLERSAAREFFELHMPLPLKPISPHVSISDGTPAPALPAQDTPAQVRATSVGPEQGIRFLARPCMLPAARAAPASMPRPFATAVHADPALAAAHPLLLQAPASTADPELDLPSHARRLLVCGFAINACPFQALLQPSRPDAVFMQLADVAADVGAERLLSALHFGALPVGLALWGAQAWGCLHSAASQAQQPALALA